MSLHQAITADLAKIFSDSNGLGVAVGFECRDGKIVADLRGIFVSAGYESKPSGATAPLSTTSPTLFLESEVVQSLLGRALSPMDSLTIGGRVYHPRRQIPNGYGLLEIPLQEL